MDGVGSVMDAELPNVKVGGTVEASLPGGLIFKKVPPKVGAGTAPAVADVLPNVPVGVVANIVVVLGAATKGDVVADCPKVVVAIGVPKACDFDISKGLDDDDA